MKTKQVYKPHLSAVWCAFTTAIFILAGSFSASAFTAADVTTCYNAWWNTFSGNSIGFWQGCEEIELVDDYGNVGNINTMCNKFTSACGTSWSGQAGNDDVMWAVIGFVRAYTVTGNTTYRTIAKNAFDMVYARAWDTKAGGMYWRTDSNYKSSCINFPSAIAAHLLSVALNDSSYAVKSTNIYLWGKTNLWSWQNGDVADGLHTNGLDWTCYSYNQGAFIGAAYYNGDSNAVNLAGQYVEQTWNTSLPVYATGGNDGGGFNGILLRWMAKAGYDVTYRQCVADSAWDCRNSANLVNCQWDRTTPSTAQNEWDCTDIVVAMGTVAASGTCAALTDGQIYQLEPLCAYGKRLDVPNSSTNYGTILDVWTANGGLNQQWKAIYVSSGIYAFAPQCAPNERLDVVSNATTNYTPVDVWPATSGNNQQWEVIPISGGIYWLVPQNAPLEVLDIYSAGCANGTPVEIYEGCNSTGQKFKFH
jgi:hypothetical protein